MAIEKILKAQYARTMNNAYAYAREAASSAVDANAFLDCGCGSGHERELTLGARDDASNISYTGLEWSTREVEKARSHGLNVIQADLNKVLPVASASQDCVIAFSVLEHLLMPCHFLGECRRVLRTGGRLVILTPNISTYFTALLVLAGRMPSSGPHPDSNSLSKAHELVRVTTLAESDLTVDMPEHRHLVVFSFLALKRHLADAGFRVEAAKGFGYYPLPMFMQPLFERIDPWHCHQMVFVCSKA